jgi:hypothetical protein
MTRETRTANTVLLVNREGMGDAEPALRLRLLRNYLALLLENRTLPRAVCFYAEAVRLVVAGSPLLDVLQDLEAGGALLISCSTCLNHLGLADQVRVGIVGGMHDIVAAQWAAEKVITL